MSYERFNSRPDSSKKEKNSYSERKRAGESYESQKTGKISRRDFLKKSALITGGLLLNAPLLKMMKDNWEESKKQRDFVGDDLERKELEPVEMEEHATEKQKEIEEEDISSLAEVLDFEKEEDIKLDPETMEAIKNHWKKRYREDPRLTRSLEQAYYNMGEWEPYLKEEFRKRNVPEKYLYLAIPESHWQLSAVSGAGAVGPYQFIPRTARAYGLKSDHFRDHPLNLEERRDPIKSARACAELLSDLYKAGKDWDMALSGYNGGFFWQYLKVARDNKDKVSYEGFLGFLENRINKIKQEIRSEQFHEHRVRPGEELGMISRRFNMNIEELCRINDIEDENMIRVGQEIKIPISERNKKELFKSKVRGLEENLNYPPKFNAIYELIEEGFVTDKKEPLKFKVKTVGGGVKKHVFQKQDGNIYRLSLKFANVSDKDILKANPHIDPNNLRGGEELVIPEKAVGSTLEEMARANGTDLARLKALNPAIKDPRRPIPEGYEIRV